MISKLLVDYVCGNNLKLLFLLKGVNIGTNVTIKVEITLILTPQYPPIRDDLRINYQGIVKENLFFYILLTYMLC